MAESYRAKFTKSQARKLNQLLGGRGDSGIPPGGKEVRDDGHSRVRLAQAPSGGIPGRSGITPGSATCTQVIIAPLGGTGFDAGDLVKTSHTFTVINWDTVAHGEDGDRIIQVSSHSNNAQLVGSSCVNEGTASNIVLYEPTE